MNLASKIIDAKELGVKFTFQNGGYGFLQREPGECHIFTNMKNDEFEKSLDIAISELDDRSFLTLLKQHGITKK